MSISQVSGLNTSTIAQGINSTVIIGERNVVQNPNFSLGLNYWSNSGSVTLTEISGGASITGTGTVYQLLNSTDCVSGEAQTALVYVSSIATNVTLKVGTTSTGSELASLTLKSGWNQVAFTAGSSTYIGIAGTGASDTVRISEVRVQKQSSLIVTGGSISSGATYISDTWRLRDDGTNLLVEKLVSGTWTITGVFTATED